MQLIDLCPFVTPVPATQPTQDDQVVAFPVRELFVAHGEILGLLQLFLIAHKAVVSGDADSLCDLEEVLISLSDLQREMKEFVA